MNDGLGMIKNDGEYIYTVGEEVGEYGIAEEKYQGMLLRKLMEKHHLLAVKTFHDLPPTYYGWDGSTSHIDQLLMPRGAMRRVHFARVLESKGRRRLQLKTNPNLRDHAPLGCSIDAGHRPRTAAEMEEESYKIVQNHRKIIQNHTKSYKNHTKSYKIIEKTYKII